VAAPGETDLSVMLEELGVERRPGVFTYGTVAELTAEVLEVAHATVVEASSTTVVMSADDARRMGHPVDTELAWLTLTVQSSLEAVGLTAAVSARLTDAGIACNVLAGYHHDHLLVPVARADEAVQVLTAPSR
jgi:uncharacterized protein